MRTTCSIATIDTDPGFDMGWDLSYVGSDTDDHADIDRWRDKYVAIRQLGYDG